MITSDEEGVAVDVPPEVVPWKYIVTPETAGPADMVVLVAQNDPAPVGVNAAGAGSTVITTVLVAAVHGPAPSGSLVVKVNVTVPPVILGVYVEVSELGEEKVPLGAVHIELLAPPPILPESVIVPPAQTDWGRPAFAVNPGVRNTVILH